MPWHGTARHSTAWHGVARHGTARHSTARHGTAWHGTARHSTARHSTAWHGVARHSTARHGTAWHGTAQHGTVRLPCPTRGSRPPAALRRCPGTPLPSARSSRRDKTQLRFLGHRAPELGTARGDGADTVGWGNMVGWG